MRRSALPLVVVACVIVAAVLAWLVVHRIFRAPADEPAGPAVAETRAPGAFTKIDASGHLDIEIAQGDRHEVVVEAAEGDQRRITTVVEGDTLRIDTRQTRGIERPGLPEVHALKGPCLLAPVAKVRQRDRDFIEPGGN